MTFLGEDTGLGMGQVKGPAGRRRCLLQEQ